MPEFHSRHARSAVSPASRRTSLLPCVPPRLSSSRLYAVSSSHTGAARQGSARQIRQMILLRHRHQQLAVCAGHNGQCHVVPARRSARAPTSNRGVFPQRHQRIGHCSSRCGHCQTQAARAHGQRIRVRYRHHFGNSVHSDSAGSPIKLIQRGVVCTIVPGIATPAEGATHPVLARAHAVAQMFDALIRDGINQPAGKRDRSTARVGRWLQLPIAATPPRRSFTLAPATSHDSEIPKPIGKISGEHWISTHTGNSRPGGHRAGQRRLHFSDPVAAPEEKADAVRFELRTRSGSTLPTVMGQRDVVSLPSSSQTAARPLHQCPVGCQPWLTPAYRERPREPGRVGHVRVAFVAHELGIDDGHLQA